MWPTLTIDINFYFNSYRCFICKILKFSFGLFQRIFLLPTDNTDNTKFFFGQQITLITQIIT